MRDWEKECLKRKQWGGDLEGDQEKDGMRILTVDRYREFILFSHVNFCVCVCYVYRLPLQRG